MLQHVVSVRWIQECARAEAFVGMYALLLWRCFFCRCWQCLSRASALRNVAFVVDVTEERPYILKDTDAEHKYKFKIVDSLNRNGIAPPLILISAVATSFIHMCTLIDALSIAYVRQLPMRPVFWMAGPSTAPQTPCLHTRT